MAEFVKICPQCQQINPEYENLCSGCGQFIGMESPQLRPVAAPKAASAAAPNAPKPSSPPITEAPAPTQRFGASPSFYLLLDGSEQIYNIESGQVLGQAHPGNPAQVQIDKTIPGSEFLHRQHCRFVYKDKTWYVQAIDQQKLQKEFTNPTEINQRKLSPGRAHPLKNGDQLTLSGLKFQVKLL